jgi:hypothetical protein
MKSRRYMLLALTVVGMASVFVMSPILSHAQPSPGSPLGLPDNSGLDTAAQVKQRIAAWYSKRTPHPACPTCFKVEGDIGIFETVPGSDQVITRDLPDPAPLKLGELRPTVHPETGEPLWYKGNQPFVGPTDEEPWSKSLPIPLIQLKRIQHRHEAKLRKIEGVHGVGIGETGFLVGILPEKRANRRLIPATIEGIPVVVEEVGIPTLRSHVNSTFRPVPAGANIFSAPPSAPPGDIYTGTLGPHVVRDVPDIGVCCQLYSLTAGHVIQDMSLPLPTGRFIWQGSSRYGFFGWMFRLSPCVSQFYPTCIFSGWPLNDVSWTPDAAAIGHDTFDQFPMYPPCNGAQKPVRRIQHGGATFSYIDGPSGIIRIPTMSTCSGNCLKTWGTHTHGAPARLRSTNVYDAVHSCFAHFLRHF